MPRSRIGGFGSPTSRVIGFLVGVQSNTHVSSPGIVTASFISISITGSRISSAVGTFKPAINKTLTGVISTGQIGIIVPVLPSSNDTVILTGVASTCAVGSLTRVVTKSLSGNVSPGQEGHVSIDPWASIFSNQYGGPPL